MQSYGSFYLVLVFNFILQFTKHAKLYYEEIINSNREIIIKKLSEAVRINIKSAKKVYEHVLINEYDLADGHHSVYLFYV